MTIDEQVFERLILIWSDDMFYEHIEDCGPYVQSVVRTYLLPNFTTGQKMLLLAGHSVYDHNVSSIIFVLEEN